MDIVPIVGPTSPVNDATEPGRYLEPSLFTLMERRPPLLAERDFETGFVRSKAKAMDPEIARNQNHDDHYANDSENVHSALLPLHDDSPRRARTP